MKIIVWGGMKRIVFPCTQDNVIWLDGCFINLDEPDPCGYSVCDKHKEAWENICADM